MFISRHNLHRQLVWAAMVRSAVTLVSMVPCIVAVMPIAFLLREVLPGRDELTGFIAFGCLIGANLGVMGLMTRFYCHRAVRCPHCGGSLWSLGTGNFKPRRMRVRVDSRACPQCGARVV